MKSKQPQIKHFHLAVVEFVILTLKFKSSPGNVTKIFKGWITLTLTFHIPLFHCHA